MKSIVGDKAFPAILFGNTRINSGENMKYKKIFIVAFILLAILTVGAVSASDSIDVTARGSDVIVSDDNVVDEISSADSSVLGDASKIASNMEETTLTAEDLNTKYNSGEGIIVNLTDSSHCCRSIFTNAI